MKLVLCFEDDMALDPGVVGHKFSHLAKAKRAGFNVPLAVAIHVDANSFYRQNRSWPDGLLDEIYEKAKQLVLSEGVSVRSSSTREDLETQSFAGQYNSYLDVRDEEDLKDKIEKCWESGESDLVRHYLGSSEDQRESPLMSVIIQCMVHPSAAGVAFSRNPMYPLREEVVIEGVQGLGEKLVSGHVTPCRVFVRDTGMEIDKPKRGIDESGDLILHEKQWREIAGLARKIEEHAGGKPQDIEWAIDRQGELWLLQCRAITTIRDADLKAPSGIWTRKIADDLWADRLTPFMADIMLRNAYKFDLSKNAEFFHIQVAKPTLSVINGYLYINCESVKTVLALLPEKLRIKEVRSLLPPGFDIDSVPSPRMFQLFVFAIRALVLAVIQPGGNPLISASLSRRFLRTMENRIEAIEKLPDGNIREAYEKSVKAIECIALLQEKNQWPYLFATVFTWASRWLIVDVAGRKNHEFLEFLSGNTGNVTTELELALQQLTEEFRRDEQMREKVMTLAPEELFALLPSPLRKKVEAFLSRYGCRARHRTLYVKRWAEAPEEVLGMITALVRNDTDRGKPVTCERKKPFSGIKGLPWQIRIVLSPLLRFSRKFLDLREDLRFSLDKILFLVRRNLMALGQHTKLGEDILFLRLFEIEQIVNRTIRLKEAEKLIGDRKKSFLEQADIYTYYIDGRPINELSSSAKVIRGIGTSPGRITGRARIVENPASSEIHKGDILVAKNTDPGWTPVLRIVGGIVVEEGGLLNHCSIVARELGIPAVVGVRQATRKIPQNARVTVDGDLGIIQVESDKT